MKVWVRFMLRRDMEEVLRIEREAFEYPWRQSDFTRSLRQRNTTAMVAESREEGVAGHAVYELSKTTIRILTLAVRWDLLRQGVGTALVANLIAKLKARGREEILVEVRETNVAAQIFYRSLGFQCVEQLKGFYDECDEDAYVFQYLHPEARRSAAAQQEARV